MVKMSIRFHHVYLLLLLSCEVRPLLWVIS